MRASFPTLQNHLFQQRSIHVSVHAAEVSPAAKSLLGIHWQTDADSQHHRKGKEFRGNGLVLLLDATYQ